MLYSRLSRPSDCLSRRNLKLSETQPLLSSSSLRREKLIWTGVIMDHAGSSHRTHFTCTAPAVLSKYNELSLALTVAPLITVLLPTVTL